MRTRLIPLAFLLALVLAITVGSSTSSAQPNAKTPFRLTAKLGATVTPRAAPLQPAQGVQAPEFRQPKKLFGTEIAVELHPVLNKTRSNGLSAAKGTPLKLEGPRKPLAANFHALDFFAQRFANGGNQFSIEPPDQGLCVGGKYVLETVNTVLRVYDKQGNPLTDVIDVNSFFGYPAQFNRTTRKIGPSVGDVSCLFDPETKRFFFLNWTLEVDPSTGNITGAQTLDIAVSKTPDPRGAWWIYHIPSQNDGEDGTPKHLDCPCLSDYPHFGMDKYGVYIATNEFPLLGPGYFGGFNGANVYGLSKHKLAQGKPTIPVVMWDTVIMPTGDAAYSIHPAWHIGQNYNLENGGTEYMMSSTNTFTRFDSRAVVYAISNTESFDTNNPNPRWHDVVVDTVVYGDPPRAMQAPGDIPLADCLNLDCFGFGPPPSPQGLGEINANDAGMKQVYYFNGKLFGATGSVVDLGGGERAGAVYHIIKPGALTRDSLDATVLRSVLFGSPDVEITFPAIAATKNGKAAIVLSLVSDTVFPSAGFVTLDKQGNLDNAIFAAALGAGPQDGFTEYFIGGGRPRWGDYSAAFTVGNTVWGATEYVGQTCDLLTYLGDTTCGGTRGALGNWGTRVFTVEP